MSSTVKAHPVRLRPGQDLKVELNHFIKRKGLRAGFVASCSGSLQSLRLRLADSQNLLERTEKFEILSLQGSFSADGPHLHLAAADSAGKVWGGHLMDGCLIYTTGEILLLELENYHFTRERDPQTGYPELVMHLLNIT
jgi:predicted DNA-binding protein with PD1-like motif